MSSNHLEDIFLLIIIKEHLLKKYLDLSKE